MAEQDSLDFLYGLQQFGIKLGLDNIRTLHERLGAPAAAMRTVLVAGTNGKGSTASTLAAILCQAGVPAGLYTSPHLHSFTERIRVDGQPVAFAELEPLIDELRRVGSDLPLTFFEFTTALALELFRRRGVTVAILEVGMGGRLDATNVVDPALSIITPIAFDHQQHLGDSLAAIAGEKAGIMRRDVPVVLAEQPSEALQALLAAAAQAGAAPIVCRSDFDYAACGDRLDYTGLDSRLAGLQPGLAGAHQQANMAVALAAAELLRRQGVTLSDHDLAAGVTKVRWPGRLEWIGPQRRILLDGAHNGAGAAALAAYLDACGCRRVRLVLGVKRDKEAAAILTPLLPYVAGAYCVEPPIEEATPADDLQRSITAAGGTAVACTSVAAALEAARAAQSSDEVVVVAGSLFLVAAAREALQQEYPDLAL